MLKKIFGSGARVKLLQQFLRNPSQAFFIRELTRILDEQINSLRRELENLEGIGLLKSKEKNRRKYYTIDPHFVLLPELTSIMRKTDERNDVLIKLLNKLGNVDLLILSGAFVGERSDVDLFIVGDITPTGVDQAIEKQSITNQPIKHGVMSKDDFLYRLSLEDKFVKELFLNRKNIILKNKLKKETESLLN